MVYECLHLGFIDAYSDVQSVATQAVQLWEKGDTFSIREYTTDVVVRVASLRTKLGRLAEA